MVCVSLKKQAFAQEEGKEKIDKSNKKKECSYIQNVDEGSSGSCVKWVNVS